MRTFNKKGDFHTVNWSTIKGKNFLRFLGAPAIEKSRARFEQKKSFLFTFWKYFHLLVLKWIKWFSDANFFLFLVIEWRFFFLSFFLPSPLFFFSFSLYFTLSFIAGERLQIITGQINETGHPHLKKVIEMSPTGSALREPLNYPFQEPYSNYKQSHLFNLMYWPLIF